jgi:hypothetical protein
VVGCLLSFFPLLQVFWFRDYLCNQRTNLGFLFYILYSIYRPCIGQEIHLEPFDFNHRGLELLYPLPLEKRKEDWHESEDTIAFQSCSCSVTHWHRHSVIIEWLMDCGLSKWSLCAAPDYNNNNNNNNLSLAVHNRPINVRFCYLIIMTLW